MQFKQYPSYKNSGVEWLGDVPDEWDIYPFWHLFNRKEITNKTQEQLLSVYLDRGVILHSEGGGMVHKPADNLEKYQLVEVNDFVMNNQQAWRGSVGVSPYKGIVSPAYLIFSFNKKICAPKFFKYFLRDKGVVDQFMIASMSVGTIQRQVKWHLLKTIQLSIPSLIEQNTIANFLDTETARIDNLISKQEKLIELLEEQRKSIISHAVTKGLNPNAPMKDSGVEWLGEVPEHWTISRVKFNFKNLDSRRVPLTSEERSYKKGNYPYYGASGIIDYIDNFIFDEDLVIFSEDGANLIYRSMPICFVATGKYWVNNHAHILKSFDELTTYWSYVLESVDVNLYITGATQPKVTAENLGNIFIAFPPSFDERLSIHNYILEESSKIDILVLKQKSLIEKLKEYRASIISHAVTGKIDVREWVA